MVFLPKKIRQGSSFTSYFSRLLNFPAIIKPLKSIMLEPISNRVMDVKYLGHLI